MRIFIVHAHHEPTSFNGAMTREATASLGAAGHEIVVSDLYAMGFDPVSDEAGPNHSATVSTASATRRDRADRRSSKNRRSSSG
jgi:putative NADPH-quinone reductase